MWSTIKLLFPDVVDKVVFTELASFFIAQKQFVDAKNLLMKIINRYSDYPKAYYVYAQYFKAINKKKDEEIMLNEVISRENSIKLTYPWESHDRKLLSKAFTDLGVIYAGLELPGKSAEAIRYFKKAIEEDPENTTAYFELAQMYFYREKDYMLAQRYYEIAQARGYDNDDLRYNLGVIYYKRSNYSRAVDKWIRLSGKMPSNPHISFALACAFLHLGSYNASLGELLDLRDTYNHLIDELGEIHPWRASHRKILLQAIAVYNNLGVTYEKLFEREHKARYQKEALIALYKAGELADIIGKNWGEVQYNLNYILHPDVVRGDMAIDDSISNNYRFVSQ